jgi:hypothetical protein
MEKSVTFTGACSNEIISSINRSFVYKAKERGHVRILNNLDLGDINSLQKEHLQVFFSRCHATLGCVTAEYKAEFLN